MMTVQSFDETTDGRAKYTAPQIDGTPEQQDAVNRLLSQFDIPTKKIESIVNHFIDEMRKGLDHEGATVAMIPSFVTGRPTGNEQGKYLALDLGGTNLRVCEFDLKGNGQFSVHQQKYIVSEELKTGEMRQLFDFIADCVDSFITEYNLSNDNQQLQLGFTFSFPVKQTEINRGTLMHWTKGFSCSGAINKDVVLMLQDAFLRKNILVNVAALVNDTVGTLMANAYRHPETAMGIIIGTGTNAAYYEKSANITKWKAENGQQRQTFDEMVVNMEWGAFDNERKVLPFTVFDNKLDRESINPREQLFEKMLSGMYLGEIARNAMLYLVDQRLLFSGHSSAEFNEQWSFLTSYMSTVVDDKTAALEETQHILEEALQIPSTTLGDRQIVQFICSIIGRRAARLTACGIAAVLFHTRVLTDREEARTVIALDGSVYEFFPNFEEQMMQTLQELYGENIKNQINFALTRDGSGFGAAIIAMMAHKATLCKTTSV